MENKKWYQGKGYVITFVVIGLLSLSALAQNDNTPKTITSGNTYNSAYSTPSSTSLPSTTNSNTNLSNNNFYINTYGNEIHSPAYSNSVPAGASARCGDGTYSFSQSRRGTCSHHGGVSEWL